MASVFPLTYSGFILIPDQEETNIFLKTFLGNLKAFIDGTAVSTKGWEGEGPGSETEPRALVGGPGIHLTGQNYQ